MGKQDCFRMSAWCVLSAALKVEWFDSQSSTQTFPWFLSFFLLACSFPDFTIPNNFHREATDQNDAELSEC